ncbi:MAG: hypothetical protein V4712_17110 [Pseudomonadota bacterium]
MRSSPLARLARQNAQNIGLWRSNGCIARHNGHIEDILGQVAVGAQVKLI